MQNLTQVTMVTCVRLCAVPEFIDPVFVKQTQNARLQSLKSSVLGLFSRKLGL
jgi:hypothetical protein